MNPTFDVRGCSSAGSQFSNAGKRNCTTGITAELILALKHAVDSCRTGDVSRSKCIRQKAEGDVRTLAWLQLAGAESVLPNFQSRTPAWNLWTNVRLPACPSTGSIYQCQKMEFHVRHHGKTYSRAKTRGRLKYGPVAYPTLI